MNNCKHVWLYGDWQCVLCGTKKTIFDPAKRVTLAHLAALVLAKKVRSDAKAEAESSQP
jgi:hypothetical protein